MGLSLKKKLKDFIRGPKKDDAPKEPLRAHPSPRQQAGALAEKAPSSCTTDSPGTPQSIAATEPLNTLQDTRDQPAAKLAPPKSSEGSIRQLWDVAYQNLRNQEESLVQDFEDQICGNLAAGLGTGVLSHAGTKDWLTTILKHKMDQVNRESWKLKFGSSEVEVQDVVKPVLAVVDWANDFVAKALVSNPYASIAWSGVSLLLPLLLNPLDQAAALAKGLEHISSLIVRSSMWEDLYVRRYESKTSEASSEPYAAYRLVLERLYREILKFQIVCYRYHNHKTASRMALDSVKHHDWEELLEQIKYHETEFDKVSNHVRDQAYTHEWENAEARHQQAMKHWENIGTDVSDLRSRVEEIQHDMKRKRLLDWLCIVDPSVQYNAARGKHQSGTCEWLVQDNKVFKTWETAPKSFLWLNGKAGSGKSILSSSVIKYLKEKSEVNPQVALAYYFFSFGNLEQQKVTVMLSSLIGQLCASRPDTPRLIKKFGDYIAKKERPDIESLETALIAAVRGFSAVYIVVDALDECPTFGGERSRLLDCFNNILTAMPDNVHILCTSRAEPDIQTKFDEVFSLPARSAISITDIQTGLNGDLGLYIDSTLATRTYEFWPNDMKLKAKKVLLARADGMFQYLVCQFDVLQQLNSEDAILSALDELPLGLDETYNRLLLSLDTAFQPHVLRSLKWLASSREPLSLAELAEIFIFDPDIAENYTKKRLFDPKGVLRYFPSLVTIENYPLSPKVRLAHFTVKEYLVSDRIQQSRAKQFHFDEESAHLQIAHCCLSYNLCRANHRDTPLKRHIIDDWGYCYTIDDMASMAIYEEQPLREYAVDNWVWHLEKVPHTLWTPEVFQLAKCALSRGSTEVEPRQRPYCYTARLGALELTKWLLSEDSWAGRFVVQEDLDLALVEAVKGGRVAVGVVQLLLNKGANPNARNRSCPGALEVASYHSNLAVMEILLDSGANIEARDDEFGSPLLCAAQTWTLPGMRMLVSRGADVRKGCVLSYLLRAFEHPLLRYEFWIPKYIEILQFLLDNGADINKGCTEHLSALHWALMMLRQKDKRGFVDFVLQHGANVNLNGGQDPLQEACSYMMANRFSDSEVIVVIETLLSMGADVNAPAGENGTALQILCREFDGLSLAAVRLLLDRGAEINQPGGSHGTALQAACERGYLELIDLLLDKGADCGVESGLYGNALQATSAVCGENALIIAKKLLERGADVNGPGGTFGSSLQAAVCRSDGLEVGAQLWNLLLSKGAEVNYQGGMYGTALQAACARGKMEAVRFLLSHGAEVNTEGGQYGSALQAACGSSNKFGNSLEMVQLLIEHGADVHVQSGEYGSAWHAAADGLTASGLGTDVLSHDTLKLLLEHGVDVNDSRSRQGRTALQTALELSLDARNVVSRVRFLLEHGADVNLRAGLYGFPLQSACKVSPHENGDVNMHGLVYLLEHCPEIDVNMTGGLFGTALQAATYYGKTEAVHLLLKKGADVNIRGGKYGSALNAAIFEGYWDLVEILLDAGAKPDCHQLSEPDEEWLKCISEDHGKGYMDRYRKFWDVMKLEWNEDKVVKEQSC